MELMNSLLVYTLAVLMPQALGSLNTHILNDTDSEDSIAITNKPLAESNATTVFSGSGLHSKINDESVFSVDSTCKSCNSCIQQAMQSHMISSHYKPESYINPLEIEDNKKRIKRKTALNTEQSNSDKKSKKIKRNKSVSIIKYNNSGKIYALKVKETQTNSPRNNSITTCQVYSIQKHFPCESPDADLILTASKRKINKNSKKKRSKRQKNVSNTKTTVIAPAFRKRQIDSSQVPEQIMPSIEEMY